MSEAQNFILCYNELKKTNSLMLLTRLFKYLSTICFKSSLKMLKLTLGNIFHFKSTFVCILCLLKHINHRKTIKTRICSVVGTHAYNKIYRIKYDYVYIYVCSKNDLRKSILTSNASQTCKTTIN